MYQLELRPGELNAAQLRDVYRNPVRLNLTAGCAAAIQRSSDAVTAILAQGKPIYGINTGFGLLARQRIADEDLQELQRRLILSHACGMGELIADELVRLIMVLKINGLALGHSGVRPELIEALATLLQHQIYPCIPAKGSVGASGDLAPLAHMSLPLLGEGTVRVSGVVQPSKQALDRVGMAPLKLGPKEGLALLNGTQFSTAMALAALFDCERIFNTALVCGALSVDAALGSDTPFDPRIHLLRRHEGQRETAAVYRELLAGSAIRASHADCSRVQDPYSLRCQPQVMGACLDNLRHAARVLEIEANAVSDNPLVFSDGGAILSGGNFHAEPVALVADLAALCIAEIGALSERRIALLIDSHLSELPPFLVKHGGLNSGFMIAQVTAAALASENKSLAHPASVDSLPTSANQEDHVSMAAFAARRLHEMLANTAGILGVELLAACQGIDLRAPLDTSPALRRAMDLLRAQVPFYDQDRYFAPDLLAASDLVRSGSLAEAAGATLSLWAGDDARTPQ